MSNAVRSDSSALFDIVLLATDKNRFAPEAWVAHTARTQPAGAVITSTTPLHQWRLLYDIDNNSSLYAWATSTGKGVIYRLIDHWNNDVPYDFYNVKFRRYKITGTTTSATAFIGQYLSAMASRDNFTIDSGDFVDLLTFNWANPVQNNTFETAPFSTGRLDLLNSVFMEECRFNRFGTSFQRCTAGGQFTNNVFGANCYDNIFAESCIRNVFRSYCRLNWFGGHSYSNTLEDNCFGNLFAMQCSGNMFGSGCSSNTFSGHCYANIFANFCYTNTFGAANTNTFGNYCHTNTFHANTVRNTQFSDDISGKDFTASNIYAKTYNQTIQRNANGDIVCVWIDASNIQQITNNF